MDDRYVLADLDEDTQLARLSAWVGAWEPCFALYRPLRDALVFVPDGTLYALSLGAPMTIALEHRERTIRKGDAIVVPQGLALEVEPEVDLLAVRCDGTAPDHFRERFIQVWGYDHFPAHLEPGEPAAELVREVIPETDLRYHLGYAIWELPGPGTILPPRFTGDDLLLLVNLASSVPVTIEEPRTEIVVPGNHVLGLGWDLTYRAFGPGRLGILRLAAEIVFQARRAWDRARRGTELTSQPSPDRHNRPDRDPRSEN